MLEQHKKQNLKMVTMVEKENWERRSILREKEN
jgi:hypothetical protein